MSILQGTQNSTLTCDEINFEQILVHIEEFKLVVYAI